MPPNTTVTALVPAFEAAEFIQPTLDSLSAQTHANFNVIVSVDRSDDDTDAICKRHAARDARFRVLCQTDRLGYVGNCNFLLDAAGADYALFAFHDDVLLPSYLQQLCAVLDTRPDVVLSFSDLVLTRVNGASELCTYANLEGLQSRAQRGLKVLNRSGNWWVPNRGIFRLDESRKIRGLKTHGAGEFSADWPWLFHMSLLGEFARVPEVLCQKYYKARSLSRSWEFSTLQHFEVAASCMRELWNSELSTEEKLRLAVPLTEGLIRARAVLRKPRPNEHNHAKVG